MEDEYDNFNDNELENDEQVGVVEYESEPEETINDEPESQIDEDVTDIITDNALYNITASEDIEFNTKKSRKYITKYEKTKLIGIRAQQLASGANPYVEVPRHITDVEKIAELEYELKRIPLIIQRNMPNNTTEYWKLDDLII